MKQVLTLIAVLLMGYAATAQSKGSTTTGVVVTPLRDTNTNTETVQLYSPDKYTAGSTGNFTVQFAANKVSGTLSGVGVLQSTVDGTTWNNLECPCSFGGTTTTQDSVTFANTSGIQSAQWHCTGVKAKQFRVSSISAGTMVYGVSILWLKD